MELRPYQQEAREAVKSDWASGFLRTLLVLPTGCGKTIVFSKIVEDMVRSGRRCLILAHRGELLDQAADKLLQATGLRCSVEKAEETCLDSWYRVTVGSIQSLMREKRLGQFPADYFDVIVVDEAHHALSDGYQRVLTYFEEARVLGVTATPDLGFQMDNLAVWDDDGNSVRLAWQAGDRYTFQMPASRVTVEAAFSAKSGAANTLPFTDVAGNAWYHAAVEYVYGGGLMSGTDGTHFSPNVTTTRGMIVTILHSMAGRPGAAGSARFLDVPAGQYYTAAVEWACASGVVSGYPDGRFRPNDPITREQFAAILYRYAQLSGRDTGAAGDLSAFQDRGKVSAYAVEAVGWAVEQGLISGMGDGNLAPGGSATRAQAAAMLTKYCESTPGV